MTLTITGDGYHLDSDTGEFDAGCQPVVDDLTGEWPYTLLVGT